MNQLILAIILSILPISELRGGLPIAINYAIKKGVSIWPIFSLIVLVNIFAIFLAFLILDYLHKHLMKFKGYRKIFGFFLKRTQKKAKYVEKRMKIYGYLALAIFVAVPIPITGAWTGTLIAWLLGLDRLYCWQHLEL